MYVLEQLSGQIIVLARTNLFLKWIKTNHIMNHYLQIQNFVLNCFLYFYILSDPSIYVNHRHHSFFIPQLNPQRMNGIATNQLEKIHWAISPNSFVRRRAWRVTSPTTLCDEQQPPDCSITTHLTKWSEKLQGIAVQHWMFIKKPTVNRREVQAPV